MSLRRPLFAGEEVTITATPPASDGDGEIWSISCRATSADGTERIVLDGRVGLGDAPWLAELEPPAPAPGQEPPEVRPTYDLDSIPTGEPLRPLAAYVKADAARGLVTDDLGLTEPADLARYLDADPPRIHPYFLAGRMAPLTRHNFTYGPTIHVRTQIQHRAPARADQQLTVGAAIVDAYERNEHWYQVLDGIVSAGTSTGTSTDGTTADRAGTTLAVIRHHTIFRPRGDHPPRTAPYQRPRLTATAGRAGARERPLALRSSA